MESTDVGKTTNVAQKQKHYKPYVAPSLRRLSPGLVKLLLSRDADTSDSELQRLIGIVDQLHGAKGS